MVGGGGGETETHTEFVYIWCLMTQDRWSSFFAWSIEYIYLFTKLMRRIVSNSCLYGSKIGPTVL
jgi:hypothetical protein